MFVELRGDDPRPVYRQIADEVQRAVSVGVLKPGEGLPPTRQLAADLKLNPNTIRHAYRTLVQEGIVEMRRGLGAFVAARPRESSRSAQLIARQIAERALRDAFRHGLLASDLMRALAEIAPGNSTTSQPSASRSRPAPRSNVADR
jgi:GntR family transcriptional regulator